MRSVKASHVDAKRKKSGVTVRDRRSDDAGTALRGAPGHADAGPAHGPRAGGLSDARRLEAVRVKWHAARGATHSLSAAAARQRAARGVVSPTTGVAVIV